MLILYQIHTNVVSINQMSSHRPLSNNSSTLCCTVYQNRIGVCNCPEASVVHEIVVQLCHQTFSFSLSATALTVNNVVKELKELYWDTLFHVLLLPISQQRRISREYATEDPCKNAVSFWLTYHPYASWRLLIQELDRNGEHSLSERLHPYAEKVTGMFDDSSIVLSSTIIQFQL